MTRLRPAHAVCGWTRRRFGSWPGIVTQQGVKVDELPGAAALIEALRTSVGGKASDAIESWNMHPDNAVATTATKLEAAAEAASAHCRARR